MRDGDPVLPGACPLQRRGLEGHATVARAASWFTPHFEPNLGRGLAKTRVKTDNYPALRTCLAPDEGGGKLKRVRGANTITRQQIFGLFANRFNGQKL